MDNMVKQRVIGAVVLVALAVIFIPMLFEQPEDDLGPVGSNLPTQPDPVVRDRIEPLTLPEPPADPDPAPVVLEQAPVEDAASADAAVQDAASLAASAVEQAAPPASETASETVSEAASAVESVVESAAAPQAPVAAAESAAAPAPVPTQAAPAVAAAKPLSGWVVQLASLSKKDNALALRARLQQLGYTAFVEEARTSQGLLFRVRVGPELERASAEKMRDRLQEQVKLKGMVTSYP